MAEYAERYIALRCFTPKVMMNELKKARPGGLRMD